MFAYLRMFADAGLQVSFWPDNQHRDRPNAKALQDLGIEVIYGEPPGGGFAEWLDRNGTHLDYVLLSRPDISLKYVAEVTARTRARKLYYGHDLHAERLRREFAVTGRQEVLEKVEFWQAAELEVWKEADIVYYPAPEEAEAVRRRLPGKTARVLAPYVYSEREIADGRARAEKGAVGGPTILFVGGFRHRPNVDAALWLAHEIVPRLKLLVPNVSTIIAGSSPPRAVTALAGEEVLVTDYISDPVLQWLYRSATVAVAPVRFGAGVKGKVVEALRYGVPLVTTIPGVQGLPGIEEAVEIAQTAEEFAAAIADLIEDPALARQRALAGLDYLEREFGYRAAVRRIAVDIPELGFLAESPGLLRR
jgi:glycosyltransferase involved in cell wall biosynthesis